MNQSLMGIHKQGVTYSIQCDKYVNEFHCNQLAKITYITEVLNVWNIIIKIKVSLGGFFLLTP